MNAKVSKRIRIVAKMLTLNNPNDYKGMVKQLKKEYNESPYHLRDTHIKESHSHTLKKYHASSI